MRYVRADYILELDCPKCVDVSKINPVLIGLIAATFNHLDTYVCTHPQNRCQRMFKLKEHLTNSILFPCSSQKQDRYSDKNVFEIDQVIILRIALMDSQPVKLFKTKKKSNTF